MLQLHWVKSTEQKWLSFEKVNLTDITTNGVYIIWHEGNPSRVVYVGQGDVASRLMAHRSRKDITQYSKYGTLRVTWAAVPVNQRDGIERYLADRYQPLVGDAHPDVSLSKVNSPWD